MKICTHKTYDLQKNLTKCYKFLEFQVVSPTWETFLSSNMLLNISQGRGSKGKWN